MLDGIYMSLQGRLSWLPEATCVVPKKEEDGCNSGQANKASCFLYSINILMKEDRITRDVNSLDMKLC